MNSDHVTRQALQPFLDLCQVGMRFEVHVEMEALEYYCWNLDLADDVVCSPEVARTESSFCTMAWNEHASVSIFLGSEFGDCHVEG